MQIVVLVCALGVCRTEIIATPTASLFQCLAEAPTIVSEWADGDPARAAGQWRCREPRSARR
ncbi:hypothetical protein [Hansschlegelia zhihuaiae]|uniref:Uncharacterized protein n=1 Tax=Hansschlegelia zhihuaiae TaxID=405005 RepID=A0A4Q0MGG2_9HYPH|nr:hypothetical protein [Hansschlegelia zhihuaiae]RXF72079.1 hypothetical protein EK403_14810 [Hansschlegelia zhihuaiae]